jgi:hypothetical protein
MTSSTATATAASVTMTNNTVVDDRRRYVETDEYIKFVRRILRAAARRVADRDIDALTLLATLQTEVDQALVDAVAGLHGSPYSWTEIGEALGTSRQAAQMRFGKKIAATTTTEKETEPCPI